MLLCVWIGYYSLQRRLLNCGCRCMQQRTNLSIIDVVDPHCLACAGSTRHSLDSAGVMSGSNADSARGPLSSVNSVVSNADILSIRGPGDEEMVVSGGCGKLQYWIGRGVACCAACLAVGYASTVSSQSSV
jgi:hypothetical protein